MARQPRIDVAGIPQHVIQRGVNRCVCFIDDSDRYVLTCYRYIELNPVRAGIVENAGEYPWSSVHANAFGKVDRLVAPHPVFLMLGPDKTSRMASYRDLLAQVLEKDEITSIREHVNQGKALGSREFQLNVESLTGLSATLIRMGRPRKS